MVAKKDWLVLEWALGHQYLWAQARGYRIYEGKAYPLESPGVGHQVISVHRHKSAARKAVERLNLAREVLDS